MKTKIVPSSELDATKSLRAEDYVMDSPGMFPPDKYLAIRFNEHSDHGAHNVNNANAVRRLISGCYSTALDKGWWEKYGDNVHEAKKKWVPEIIGSKVALMHSELSEALEELRNRRDYGMTPYFSKGDQIIEIVSAGLRENAKPEGLAAELADAVIRIFDLAGWLGLDLAKAIEWKMQYNKTRSHKHGGKSI
jgi:NTP pyrophosphatase (non-canonical NTP hydrolase)